MVDETNIENLDSPNETTGGDNTNEGGSADGTSEEKIAKLQEQNKRLFERAKKAEGFVFKDGQWVKPEPKPEPIVQETKNNQPVQPDITDELKLIARGLSDELIDQAKVIAKGKGISLGDALKDPLFTAYKADSEERERKEKSKLGATSGSGQAGDEPLVKPGMSRDDHMKVFKEKLNG